MMVQAMFIYYGLAMLWGIYLPMLPAALLVVSVQHRRVYGRDRARRHPVHRPGPDRGAKAIGMTHVQTMLYVVLPQALRNIMPQIGNNLIINIKDTCVLSVIGTVEAVLHDQRRGRRGIHVFRGVYDHDGDLLRAHVHVLAHPALL